MKKGNFYKGLMFSKADFEPIFFQARIKNKFWLTIHSLFCPPFEAVWLDENKNVVEMKLVTPNQFSVAPSLSSVYLIEAPVGWFEQNSYKDEAGNTKIKDF